MKLYQDAQGRDVVSERTCHTVTDKQMLIAEPYNSTIISHMMRNIIPNPIIQVFLTKIRLTQPSTDTNGTKRTGATCCLVITPSRFVANHST